MGCINVAVIQLHDICKAYLGYLYILGGMNQTVQRNFGLRVYLFS